MFKICYKCKESKPVEDYCKDKSSKDGLVSRCYACRKAEYYNRKATDTKQYIIHNDLINVADSNKHVVRDWNRIKLGDVISNGTVIFKNDKIMTLQSQSKSYIRKTISINEFIVIRSKLYNQNKN